jgi:membrane protease YdiL (CAAX protease family)
VLASVAEEAAFRGVGWSILRYALGNPWLSAVPLCVAFAVVHWSQGWKSGIAIFGLAVVLHALVAFTGSLLPAMAVHAIYDFVAGEQIRRQARMMDAARAATA